MESINLFMQSSSSVVREALLFYFSPLVSAPLSKNKSLIDVAKLEKELKKNNEEYNRTLAIIGNTICYNQGSYIQYAFLTAEKHKNLKQHFMKKHKNAILIRDAAKELIDYLNESFYNNTYKNFEDLHSYFDERNSVKPRICIKGSFKVRNKNSVVTVFRDNIVNYESSSEITNSTAFYRIANTGKYYIENDIPNAVKKGCYKSPRLNVEKVKSLYSKRSRDKTKPNNWAECWKDFSSESDQRAYYKSTMVVPMTLWNNDLSEEFKKLIKIENVDRTIFGFLCFDHIEEGFFNEEKDTSIAYIFADILSLYALTRIIYTEISESYNKVEQYLDTNDLSIVMEQIEEVLKKTPDFVKNINIPKFSPKETKNNQLMPIDKFLFEYSRIKENLTNTST